MRESHRPSRLLEAASAPGVTAISHHSAAHIHGLLADPPRLIHVISLRGHHPQPPYGVIVHHTRELDPRDCGEPPSLPGVPVTLPALTVVMLGAYLSDSELRAMVALALGERHCSVDALRDAVARRTTRGRRGPRRVLAALDRVLSVCIGHTIAL
jgi:hypothetical protein